MTPADRNALLLSALPTIRSVVRRHACPGSELFADLLQTACVRVLEVADRYDPANPTHATFNTFAWHWARHAVNLELGRGGMLRHGANHSEWRRAMRLALCLDEGHIEGQIDNGLPRIDDVVAARERLCFVAATMREEPKRRKQKIRLEHLWDLALGATFEEVARKHRVSRQRVQQVHARLIAKLARAA